MSTYVSMIPLCIPWSVFHSSNPHFSHPISVIASCVHTSIAYIFICPNYYFPIYCIIPLVLFFLLASIFCLLISKHILLTFLHIPPWNQTPCAVRSRGYVHQVFSCVNSASCLSKSIDFPLRNLIDTPAVEP